MKPWLWHGKQWVRTCPWCHLKTQGGQLGWMAHIRTVHPEQIVSEEN